MKGLGPYLPKGYEKDFEIISSKVDWLGINYYTRKLIASDGTNQFPALKEVEGPLPKTEMNWEIYPEGLHHFITWADREYTKGLPIVITENGMASKDKVVGNKVEDFDRIAFIDRHLHQVKRAIDDGAPVKGYMIWSLLDNFEWSLGYDKRFGLVHVDFESQQRTPKSSWHAVKSAFSKT